MVMPVPVDIYVADLGALSGLYDAYFNLLCREEKERAHRFVSSALTRDFVLSHGVMRTILARHLGLAPDALLFFKGDRGKPFIVDEQSKGLQFNMSHSGNYAVVAVSEGASLGVDIQYHDKSVDVLALAQRFFSADEYQRLLSAAAEDQLALFYRFWSLKEAFIKAVGLGLSLPLADFSIVDGSLGLSVRGVSCYAQKPWSLYFCSDIPQFSLACLVEGEGSSFSLNYFTD
jgi:4'-phosphopantetheinyl transferase